jgi:hypothetical protein
MAVRSVRRERPAGKSAATIDAPPVRTILARKILARTILVRTSAFTALMCGRDLDSLIVPIPQLKCGS